VAIGLGLALTLVQGAAAATEPSAQLNPSEIAVDEAAELRVAAEGGKRPALPSADGLHFQCMGQSSEMSSINGAVSQHTWIIYQVSADRPGTYSVQVGSQTLQLKVDPAGSRHAATSAADPMEADQAPLEPEQQGPLALLHVALPNHKLYVGQSVPIVFKAYFRAGTQVTLNGAPNLGVPAFTISHLSDQPRQTVESIGGVPYRVATWTGQASAAMAGSYKTKPTLSIMARYREASRRRAADPFAGMLDDDSFPSSPMFRSLMSQSPFGGGFDDLLGQVREREMNLQAPMKAVEVLALPASGMPAGFSGAIGHFDVHASLAPTAGMALEPMSLKIEISGHGNFDRASTTGISSSEDWKSYPPSSKVNQDGTKVFEQAVIPQKSGRLELPAVSFSFFDPDRGQYQTRATAPIAVDVAVAAAGAAAPPPATLGTSPAAESTATATQLRPNRVDEGHYTASLLPPYRRSWFWPALSVPWLALAIALAWARKSGGADSERALKRARRQSVAQRRMAMRRAAAAKDPVGFFEAAQAALQERLSESWGIAPKEVTAAEAESRLGEEGAPIVAALRTAEHSRFANAAPDPSALADYDKAIERQLDQLEKRP